MENQKAKEWAIVERLREIYPSFPQGRIEGNESPDFLVHADTAVIGIEVKHYFRGHTGKGSPIRHCESSRQSLVEKAQQELEEQDTTPLMVSFFWIGQEPVKKASTPKMARSIAKLIAQHYPKEIPSEVQVGWERLQSAGLGNVLDHILIRRLYGLTENDWGFPEAGFVGLQPEELQDKIDSKEAKSIST